jgi:uncharacterized membrane protein
MTRLALGILLWSLIHFVPAAFTGLRSRLVSRLGEKPYKGIFTLLMVGAIFLMISGWKSAVPGLVYVPPSWGRYATIVLMLAAFVLFFAPYTDNNFKRVLRHPQLAGVMVWGVGHLLANGDSRSLLLFGGLALWALIEIVLINRRDGARARPPPAPVRSDVIRVLVGAAAFAAMAAAHQWLFGISPFY